MPSLPDTAVIIVLGLLLFGPKGLAQIARQLGKLMGEFRRASNEFRMQMEEELRIAEQADRQKEIAAMQAAAPVAPPLPSTPVEPLYEDAALMPPAPIEALPETASGSLPPSDTLPIAASGELLLMPPATGLPEPRSASFASLIEPVPKSDPKGAATNGNSESHLGEDQRPMRYTSHNGNSASHHDVAAEESFHG